MPDSVRDQILVLGQAAVPELIAILDDDELYAETGLGGGWSPIHAVDLLADLRADDAVGPMLRTLATSDFLDLVHDRLLSRMPEIGAPVVEPALQAYADSAVDVFRSSVAAVLSRVGIRDERIFQLLVERLDIEPSEARHVVDYGDQRALPHLHATLDRCELSDARQPFANQDLIELSAAIDELGGVLTVKQRDKMRRVDEHAQAYRSAFLGTLDPLATKRRSSKLGRNEPCWCESGRKYKVCHLRADQDMLLVG